jgi:flavin-dependent dehydrogenase
MLLVGDAAGLAYPESGEGIRPAVESGLIAADVILSCHGRYREDDLGRYAQRVLDRFGEPRRRAATDWLPVAWLQSAASRLLASRWFARTVLMDRWFLRASQPALCLQHLVN